MAELNRAKIVERSSQLFMPSSNDNPWSTFLTKPAPVVPDHTAELLEEIAQLKA